MQQTIEYFPEEGKYHLSGHRRCGISQTPDETFRDGSRCPQCGRPLTLGVLRRVRELSGRELSRHERPVNEGARRPYTRLAPLIELLAHTLGKGRATKSVGSAYNRICRELGGEVQVFDPGRI